MAFKVAFTLLVALCVIELSSASLDNLRYQLNKAKSDVDSIVRDLRRSRTLLQISTNSRLNNLMSESSKNVDNFLNSAIKDIKADADKAKAEGKNAAAVDKCNDDAKNNLKTASTNGFNGLFACKDKASKAAEIHLNKLDAAELTGEQLLRELDNVFPSCFSVNDFQMQMCISIKLGTINQSIRNYDNSIFSIKNDAESGANSAAISVMSCNFDVESQARSKSTEQRIAATKCLKNA